MTMEPNRTQGGRQFLKVGGLAFVMAVENTEIQLIFAQHTASVALCKTVIPSRLSTDKAPLTSCRPKSFLRLVLGST
jgi:hypothetical protein